MGPLRRPFGSWPVGLFEPPSSPDVPATSPPPPPPSHAGVGKPFVERVPDAEAGSQRLRRHTEKVSTILNSLMSSGVLVQTGPSSWTIDSSAISPADGGLSGSFTTGSFGTG